MRLKMTMNSSPDTPQERFEEDIKHIDEIVMVAADILFELEKALASGQFNIDTFGAQVCEQFHLDETRSTLFKRALERYRQAIDYTQGGAEVLTGFLDSTKLTQDAYDTLQATVDPKRPGIIVIHLKGGKDAAQFDADTESELSKKLKAFGAETGASVTIYGEGRAFIGKSVDLETLGIDKDLPILGVIVVCDEVGDQTEKEGVTNHEYAHALYKSILQPFLHKYLSGAQFKQAEEFTAWTTKFSEGVRDKLFLALGDFSTGKTARLKHTIQNPPVISRRRPSWEALIPGVKVITPKEQLDEEYYDVLYEEQKLMDEMRAYGFSHPSSLPTPSPTPLRIEAPTYTEQRGYMDPAMVERYFKLHLLVLRSYYQSSDLHLKVLSILGASQTLAQATRLIEPLTAKSPWQITSKKDFDELITIVSSLMNPDCRPIYALEKSTEAVISNQEVIRGLLPDLARLEAAADHYYPQEKPEELKSVLDYFDK